ncbi:MAG TPA: sugar phosphate isomerase/epimerase family protein [Planctomycetota bacterium]|nr:sugar phosphate isomerase/epimerase family protein [Planctomycetota bacterium]
MHNASNLPFGIYAWFGHKLPLSRRLALIKSAGFHATCLWWGEAEELRGEQRHQMPPMVKETGLLLDNFHAEYTGCNDFWSDSAPVREAIAARHTGWLDDCALHGAPRLVMHISDGRGPERPHPESIRCIERVVRAAEERGITLAVENTMRADLNDLVFTEIQSPRLGFCFDSSHAWLNSDQKTAILARWGHLLAVTHLSDNDGQADRHWLPGSGTIDWPAVAAAFPQSTYHGCLMLEALAAGPEVDDPPETYLARARQKIEWIAKLIHGTRRPPAQSTKS